MDALDFELPVDRIATRPVEPRDHARLLVCSRSDPRLRVDARVSDLPAYLQRDDLLVFNRSAVLPARLRGQRVDTGGSIEGLYLATVPARNGGATHWRCLLKSNGVLRPGTQLALHDAQGEDAAATLTLIERDAEAWLVQLGDASGQPLDESAESVLWRAGLTPLPPYIIRARKEAGEEASDVQDRAWYQTVYADLAAAGSVAAPTAGLHFTPALLDQLAAAGVQQREVLLHVSEGTFRPVTAANLEEHPMHAEWISVPDATLRSIERSRQAGGRCFAVGTTSCRALESVPARFMENTSEPAGFTGQTRLLIAPGSSLHWVDGLLTNFHLPRSTLLALVAAFFELPGEPGSGVARVQAIYQHAIAAQYRFFSYGDAMLILP